MSDTQEDTVEPSLNDLLPTSEEFLMKVPLYESFKIDGSCFSKLYYLQFFENTIDWYCLECELPTIFEGTGTKGYSVVHSTVSYVMQDKLFTTKVICQRKRSHYLQFVFKVANETIVKIGQHPSMADLYSAEIGKYRKILGNERYRELSRAVGLCSHGVGIGAFVYLRRIFEGLISEAYENARASEGWDDGLYSKSRMDERILLLQDHLPEFLVENRTLYSILSKGIHFLTEQECLKFFDTIKIGIELILDEKMQQEQKRQKIQQAKKAIDNIKTQLS